MNTAVLAVSILGTFGHSAVRPSALTYQRAVTFTLNQDITTDGWSESFPIASAACTSSASRATLPN